MIKSISIVIPFYNEKKRINVCLSKIKNFFYKINKIIKTEIIFVDDGSADNSKIFIKKFLKENNIRNKIVILKKNSGKGAALKAGVVKADFQWVLTCDLDMSVSLFELTKWLKKNYIDREHDIYVGSRKHIYSVVSAKYLRRFLGFIMQVFINTILRIKIKDTQCGFKLYKKKVAKLIFRTLKNKRFEHDVEIFLIAKLKKIRIKELPVTWKHVSNSKLNLFKDPISMLIGIFTIKYRYFFSTK